MKVDILKNVSAVFVQTMKVNGVQNNAGTFKKSSFVRTDTVYLEDNNEKNKSDRNKTTFLCDYLVYHASLPREV